MPWEGLGEDFGRKIWRRKKNGKTSRPDACLGGYRGPRTRRDLGRIRARGVRSSTPSLILRMGGRIEPAQPEPPPAHSLGRIDEDVMGRSGQLVRPRSLDTGGVAGGVAGGEELVARLVVRLVFSLFF